ncbi:MAG: hypothetical protein J5604_06630 [Bacteroidales bacterium]|nr:hypothetical protein [Bacteroidales bacterium]
MDGFGCLLSIVEAVAWGFIFLLLWKAGPEPSTGEKIFNAILTVIMLSFGGYLLYKEIKKINKEGDNQKDSEVKSRKRIKRTAYYNNREHPGITLSSYEDTTDNQITPKANSYYVSLVHNEANDTYRINVYSESEYEQFMQQADDEVLTIIADHIYPSKKVASSIQTALYNSFTSNKTVGEWFNLDKQEVQQIKETLS